MTEQQINNQLLAYPGVILDQKTDPTASIYTYQSPSGEGKKIIAIVKQGSNPLQITLRCDRLLAKLLRSKYESVVSATKLNPRDFISIINSGQLSEQEVFDLIRHGFELSKTAAESADQTS